jgi:hypothetical protein
LRSDARERIAGSLWTGPSSSPSSATDAASPARCIERMESRMEPEIRVDEVLPPGRPASESLCA